MSKTLTAILIFAVVATTRGRGASGPGWARPGSPRHGRDQDRQHRSQPLPLGQGPGKNGQRVERLSNGSVQVKIYPGGIAGGEQDMIRKMRLGSCRAECSRTWGWPRSTIP